MSVKKHYGYANRTIMKISCALGLIIMAVGVRSIFNNDLYFGIAELIVGASFFVYNAYMHSRLGSSVNKIIDMVVDEGKADYTTDVLQLFPLPMAIMQVDGNVLWYNNEFSEFAGRDNFVGHTIEDVIPSLKWGYILKAKGTINRDMYYNDRVYNVKGRFVRHSDENNNESYFIYLFFIDKTKEQKINKLYYDEKTDVAIINIDNYEYIIQKTDDSKSQNILYNVAKELNAWINKSGGVLKKTDRDRYFALFEHKHLNEYIEDKFSILEKVRGVGEEAQIPLSISMGIGAGGNISENEISARNALEMAVGRGGDQAAIKDETQYRFFGAKNNEYEKSNRLKTRAVAIALKDFINGVEKVIIMGHSGMDYDCFGAAMGLQRVVKTLGKVPYVLIDNILAIKRLYNFISETEEYKELFVNGEDALDIADSNTLIIIVDTVRKSLLPKPELLNKTEKIVVIDHHRRSTDYISPCSLIYNEPFASSTCEMVTELMQYIGSGSGITGIEAQSLYMGILMDTKNFLLKTGVRTFEAASYLKRHGIDTVAVKKMFSIDKDEYILKAKIVESLEHITENVTLAVCTQNVENIRTVASQAADEMLNVDNSQASFVLYPYEHGIGISGRSFGEMNVQLILETLGGGGHQTVAGAQLHTTDMEHAKELLRKAVLSYVKDNENKLRKE